MKHKSSQRDLFKRDACSPEVWRQAAETALHDPHYSEAERVERAAYYNKQADSLERGE